MLNSFNFDINTLEGFRMYLEEKELRRLDLARANPVILVKKNKRVKMKKYYIIDMVNPKKPFIIDHQFDNKQQAYRNIDKEFKNNRVRYWVMKGIMFLGYRVQIARPYDYRMELNLYKHEYPVELTTEQERKTFRTRLRYQLRIKKGKKGRLVKNG